MHFYKRLPFLLKRCLLVHLIKNQSVNQISGFRSIKIDVDVQIQNIWVRFCRMMLKIKTSKLVKADLHCAHFVEAVYHNGNCSTQVPYVRVNGRYILEYVWQ